MEDKLHKLYCRFLIIKKIPNIGFVQTLLRQGRLRVEQDYRLYSNFTMNVNDLQNYILSNKMAGGIKESIFLYRFITGKITYEDGSTEIISEEILLNKKFADGGMAQLGDVSGMLPSPLPMSVIQPMSKGGYVGLKVRSKNLRGGYNNYVIIGYNEMYEKYTLKDVKTDLTTTATTKELKDIYEFVDDFAVGGSAQEISYIDRRIKNLEGLVDRVNESEKSDIYENIENLKLERYNLQNPSGISKKTSWFFDKGGDVEELEKLEEKIDVLEDTVEQKLEQITGEKEDEEEDEEDEYDVYDNKRMLQNQANEVEHHSEELNKQVSITKQVPAWVISKMERATTDLSDITHYLDGENKMELGGKIGDVRFDISPYKDKFVIFKTTYKQHEDYTYPSKEIIMGFDGKFLEFNDMKSAQNFIDNMDIKYPYGIPKANAGAILLASQMLQQKQQPQQPQVVYYIPQEQEMETEIIQNIPQAGSGGIADEILINDFCIQNLIELANEIQQLKYFLTDRVSSKSKLYENVKAKLVLVFKEPAQVKVVNAVKEFVERAEDCHHIFDQSINVSGSEPNTITINLLTDNFTDKEFGKGGKVYENSPKKINIEKTKKISTILGDYKLGLITEDFIYYVNEDEGDDNANTKMYNKKGELISDNYFATEDLFENLLSANDFEYISPNMKYNRKELLKQNN